MAEIPGLSGAPRRFYKDASVTGEATAFAVRLDDRMARTPGGRALELPTRALGELVAEEWRGQDETIDYGRMPATRLAHTAIDVVSKSRALSLEGVLRYAGTDLLCYLAEGPGSLVRREQETWGPLLDWAREAHGLAFAQTSGIIHRDQPPETMARLRALLESLDDFSVAGLAFAAAVLGSAVLALALRAGRIDAEEAMAASRLDEIFEEGRWGVDAEAAARAHALTVEAVMAGHWFAALR